MDSRKSSQEPAKPNGSEEEKKAADKGQAEETLNVTSTLIDFKTARDGYWREDEPKLGEFGTFFSAIESLKTNPELPPVKETPANPSVHIQMPVARPITPKKSTLIHSCHLNGPGPCILPVTILTKKSSLSKNIKKPPHPAKVNPAKQLAPKATTNAAPEALPNKPSTTVLEQGKIPRSTPKDNSTDKHLALDAKSNQTQSFKVDEPTIGQPNGRKAIPKQDPTLGTAVRANSAKASLIKMPETYKSSERFAKP